MWGDDYSSKTTIHYVALLGKAIKTKPCFQQRVTASREGLSQHQNTAIMSVFDMLVASVLQIRQGKGSPTSLLDVSD
jgi:hypothetical protein